MASSFANIDIYIVAFLSYSQLTAPCERRSVARHRRLPTLARSEHSWLEVKDCDLVHLALAELLELLVHRVNQVEVTVLDGFKVHDEGVLLVARRITVSARSRHRSADTERLDQTAALTSNPFASPSGLLFVPPAMERMYAWPARADGEVSDSTHVSCRSRNLLAIKCFSVFEISLEYPN